MAKQLSFFLRCVANVGANSETLRVAYLDGWAASWGPHYIRFPFRPLTVIHVRIFYFFPRGRVTRDHSIFRVATLNRKLACRLMSPPLSLPPWNDWPAALVICFTVLRTSVDRFDTSVIPSPLWGGVVVGRLHKRISSPRFCK